MTDEKTPAEDVRPILIGVNGVKGSGKDTVARAIKVLVEALPSTPGQAYPSHHGSSGWWVRRDGFADRLKLSAANALGHLTGDVDEAVRFINSLKGERPDGSDVTIDLYEHYVDARPQLVHRITGRQFQQYYGTEAHRDVFGKDFWINLVLPNREVDSLGRPQDFFFGRPYDPDGTSRDGLGWQEILVIPDVRFDDEAEAIKQVGGTTVRVQRDSAEESGDGHASEQPLMGDLVDYVIDNNDDFVHLYEGVVTFLSDAFGFEFPFEIDDAFVR